MSNEDKKSLDVEITSKTPEEVEKQYRVLVPARAAFQNLTGNNFSSNPWVSNDVDKMSSKSLVDQYSEAIKSCRFFYRKDALASSVINKLVDISITGLVYSQGKTTDNVMRVYDSLKDELIDFAEDCALEYLLSGLIIPEMEFVEETKKQLVARGIKTYPSLLLPDSLWIRNAESIVINSPLIGGKPSYFVKVPDEMAYFIKNKGKYPDGTEDKELYNEIVKLYPDFVRAILENVKAIPLENPMAFRRRALTDSPYPTPYLYAALESLKHKRNIRRMDYSIASRVISAIQLIRMGDKDFPLIEQDSAQLNEIRNQMRWRSSSNKDVERIFQLFANHTLDISWVFPPTEALLDDVKYRDVNSDIIYALGFPRILITGETERSGTSDSDLALLSPVKTMENLRAKILRIIKKVVEQVAEENNFKNSPEVRFEPLNLHAFSEFMEGLQHLYEAGNVSRTTHAQSLGYNFKDEALKRAEEKDLIEELDIDGFAEVPHSNTPNSDEDNSKPNRKKEE